METERKRRGSVAEELLVDGVFNGIFAGWGESRVVAVEYQSYEKVSVVADTTENPAAHQENSNASGGKHAKLNTLLSVSIAGCDLMGSALYTAGTCFSNAGKVVLLSIISYTVLITISLVCSGWLVPRYLHAFLVSKSLQRSRDGISCQWWVLQLDAQHYYEEDGRIRRLSFHSFLHRNCDSFRFRCRDLCVGCVGRYG